MLFICLLLTSVLSAVLQRDHGNQAKTKVQQLGLRQKSFASGLATIPLLDLLQSVATGGILAMFASVLETMCTETVTPWVHCPHGHCVHASTLHNEPSDQAHWFTSHPSRLWSVRIPQGTCGNWRYVSFPMILRLFTKFDHQPLNTSLLLVKRLLCI